MKRRTATRVIYLLVAFIVLNAVAMTVLAVAGTMTLYLCAFMGGLSLWAWAAAGVVWLLWG